MVNSKEFYARVEWRRDQLDEIGSRSPERIRYNGMVFAMNEILSGRESNASPKSIVETGIKLASDAVRAWDQKRYSMIGSDYDKDAFDRGALEGWQYAKTIIEQMEQGTAPKLDSLEMPWDY